MILEICNNVKIIRYSKIPEKNPKTSVLLFGFCFYFLSLRFQTIVLLTLALLTSCDESLSLVYYLSLLWNRTNKESLSF
jgi:hypothetical protein